MPYSDEDVGTLFYAGLRCSEEEFWPKSCSKEDAGTPQSCSGCSFGLNPQPLGKPKGTLTPKAIPSPEQSMALWV